MNVKSEDGDTKVEKKKRDRMLMTIMLANGVNCDQDDYTF